MCAIEAGKRGRQVIVIDHSNKAGKKILMSGGGRCNFTNYQVEAENFLSENPHFCKSALSRYTQWDFLDLVNRYRIPYHERDHGQLFCNDSAKDILNMLLNECADHQVEIILNTQISNIQQLDDKDFLLTSGNENYRCQSLVIASGGLSIPKMSASPFGYRIAEQFNIPLVPTRAGLAPLTWQDTDKTRFSPLSGIAIHCRVSLDNISFTENVLFTHRGLSGPAILQISSYWRPGQTIQIDFLPDADLIEELTEHRRLKYAGTNKNLLAKQLPKRFLESLLSQSLLDIPVTNCSDKQIKAIAHQLQQWSIMPNGTEGYRTAEVTVGGINCNALSSKTMESKAINGLYFIGEVVDVTGWLGGYNFQWAWSSGWCAGQYV